MKTALLKSIALGAAVLVMALATPAAADTVSYTVGAYGPLRFPGPVTPPEGSPWGPDGYPGDMVELETYTGTLDLTPGTCTLKINTLQWTIDYTYAGTEDCWDWPDCWSELAFNLNTARSMSVGTTNGALAQEGLLEVDWDDDYISLAGGSTASFLVGSYVVYVTPLALARTPGLASALSSESHPGRAAFNNPPYAHPALDVYARFVVEKALVPVAPTTWGAVKALFR